MKWSLARANRWVGLTVILIGVAVVVLWQGDRAVSTPETTRFPLDLLYSTSLDGKSTLHEIHIDSWTEWTYTQVDGDAAGYTVIADGTGLVVAGYEEWPVDEWVELEPEGSDHLALPNSWFRPYFFEDGREPGAALDDAAQQAKQRLDVADADDVRAFQTDDGTSLIYHVQTGLPLYLAEPNGFALTLLSIESADKP